MISTWFTDKFLSKLVKLSALSCCIHTIQYSIVKILRGARSGTRTLNPLPDSDFQDRSTTNYHNLAYLELWFRIELNWLLTCSEYIYWELPLYVKQDSYSCNSQYTKGCHHEIVQSSTITQVVCRWARPAGGIYRTWTYNHPVMSRELWPIELISLMHVFIATCCETYPLVQWSFLHTSNFHGWICTNPVFADCRDNSG